MPRRAGLAVGNGPALTGGGGCRLTRLLALFQLAEFRVRRFFLWQVVVLSQEPDKGGEFDTKSGLSLACCGRPVRLFEM